MIDQDPRCWRCHRALAEYMGRPWSRRCHRCKAQDKSEQVEIDLTKSRGNITLQPNS